MTGAKYHVIQITEDLHKIVRISSEGEIDTIHQEEFKHQVMDHLLSHQDAYTLTTEQTQQILHEYIDKLFINQKQQSNG